LTISIECVHSDLQKEVLHNEEGTTESGVMVFDLEMFVYNKLLRGIFSLWRSGSGGLLGKFSMSWGSGLVDGGAPGWIMAVNLALMSGLEAS
jgi:hypothetical protein